MSSENKAILRTYFEVQDRDVRTPLELFTPDFSAHMPGAPSLNAGAFEEREAMFFAAFSNVRHLIEDVVAEDHRVAFRITLEGTHTGDFMGIPASNSNISISAFGFVRIADGKIAEFWGLPDMMSLMQQIGESSAAEQPAAG